MPRRNDGRELEQATRQTLKQRGWTVNGETILGNGKRVDLFAVERHLRDNIRYAIEVKDYKQPLRREQVAKVMADYRGLLGPDTDQVLIVTRNGLSPSADTLIRSEPGFRHSTIRDLQNSLIDFDEYLGFLVEYFEYYEPSISEVYQPLLTEDGSDLEDTILDWINAPSVNAEGMPKTTRTYPTLDPNRPIAILASYGMGKSSFARHLCATLASEALAHVGRRIPILLDLGRVAGEQDLEGLLAREFRASHVVPGFSVDRFLALNRAGQFAVIFDGFDEMKQRQSWSEFTYNLSEIGRLCEGDTRVVILGRPTAFPTEDHLHEVLHAGSSEVRRLPIGDTRGSAVPDYQVVRLRGLRTDDVRRFLNSYLGILERNGVVKDQRWLSNRIDKSLRDRAFRDLAKRPVQLRMLAGLLPTHPEILDGIEVHRLYDMFIDSLIDEIMRRETAKQTRRDISLAQRRRFAEGLAYWLWTTAAEPGFGMVDQIPRELVLQSSNLAADSPATVVEAERRELVMGSPIDLARNSRLAFPHRSIQEYLVSQEAWRRIVDQSLSLSSLNQLMSDEVGSFMNSTAGIDEDAAATRLLGGGKGLLKATTIRALSGRHSMVGLLAKELDSIVHHQRSVDSRGLGPILSPWILLASAVGLAGDRAQSAHHNVDYSHLAGLGPASVEWAALCLLCASVTSGDMAGAVTEMVTQITSSGDVVELEPLRVGEEFHYQSAYFRYDFEWVGGTQVIGWYDDGSARKEIHIGLRLSGGKVQRARKSGRPMVAGNVSARVRRLSGAQRTVASAFGKGYSQSALDLKSLRGVLGDLLAPYAMVEEWHRSFRALHDATASMDGRLTVPGLSGAARLCKATHGVEVRLRGQLDR